MYLCRFSMESYWSEVSYAAESMAAVLGSICLSYVLVPLPTGHLHLCMYNTHVHFPFSGKSAHQPPHVKLSRVATYDDVRRDRLWVSIVGNGFMYILLGGRVFKEGRWQKKKKETKMYRCMYVHTYMYNTKVEFSDSLGDSEVVRVLGNNNNAILHITKWALVQAPTSGPVKMHVDSQSLSASRSKRHFTPVGKSWVKEICSLRKCVKYKCAASWQVATNGRMQTDAGKGAHPAPELLFLLGSTRSLSASPCGDFPTVFTFRFHKSTGSILGFKGLGSLLDWSSMVACISPCISHAAILADPTSSFYLFSNFCGG